MELSAIGAGLCYDEVFAAYPMRSMEGVIMAATVFIVPTKLPPLKSARSAVLPRRLPVPARHRQFDAAHEHWPKDNFHAQHQDRPGKEHCPPEVYVG